MRLTGNREILNELCISLDQLSYLKTFKFATDNRCQILMCIPFQRATVHHGLDTTSLGLWMATADVFNSSIFLNIDLAAYRRHLYGLITENSELRSKLRVNNSFEFWIPQFKFSVPPLNMQGWIHTSASQVMHPSVLSSESHHIQLRGDLIFEADGFGSSLGETVAQSFGNSLFITCGRLETSQPQDLEACRDSLIFRLEKFSGGQQTRRAFGLVTPWWNIRTERVSSRTLPSFGVLGIVRI